MASKPAPANSFINICPLGMDQRSYRTLQHFFERLETKCCVLSDETHADVVMIDVDAYQNKALLASQLQSHPARPLILLSVADAETNIPTAVLVRKPIKVDVFTQILQDVSRKVLNARKVPTQFSSASEKILRAKLAAGRTGAPAVPQGVDSADVAAVHLDSRSSSFYIGSMPDVDLKDPAQRAKVYYDPQNFLHGHFRRAFALGIEHASVVRLSGSAFQDIDIYPFAKRVIASATGSVLYAAGRLPVGSGDVTIKLLDKAPHFPEAGEATERLDVMLWKLALWASRGRIPVGTDLDWPIYLKRWPNLTRLLVPPHAARIAGLWARQRYSLMDTAATLGIPQRYIFAFYSACSALELAAPAQRAADALVEPVPPKANDKRGFFRLLLGRLRRNRDEMPE